MVARYSLTLLGQFPAFLACPLIFDVAAIPLSLPVPPEETFLQVL